MTTPDSAALQGQIKDAARASFTRLMAERPTERFYAFALYTDDGAMTVCPSANSEEGLARRLQGSGETDVGDPALRWSTAQWAYESAHAEPFDPICAMLSAHVLQPDLDDSAFDALRVLLLQAMVNALGELDAEGFFGGGAEREQRAIFCSISDSEDADDYEDRSGERLNPPAVARRFAARWAGAS